MNTSAVPVWSRRVAALSHAIPLATFTSCWQMRPVFIKVNWAFVASRVEWLYGRQIAGRNVGLWPIFAG